MSKRAAGIINAIIDNILDGVNKVRYLEIGCDSWGHTLNKVKCLDKTGVDITSKKILAQAPDRCPQAGFTEDLNIRFLGDKYFDVPSDDF